MDFKKARKKTLSTFLFQNSVFKDMTHIDMVKKRNYRVRWEDKSEFLALYTNAIKWSLNFQNTEPYYYHILEKVQDLSPMVVDIDIKVKSKKVKSLYTEKHVLRLTRIFQKILKKNIKTKLGKEDLDCFVLEKDPYLKDGYCKNGFHLHFPHIWLTKKDRYRINFLVEKVIPGTQISHLKPDNSVVHGNWLMYGSSKSHETGVYTVSYIIEEKRKKIPNISSTAELIYLLSVTPKGAPGAQKFMELKPWVEDTKTKKTSPEKTHTFFGETFFKELKHYISFLKDTHSEDFVSWRAIGCALFNETNGSEKGRALWHKFSKGCPEKYSYCASETFWNKLEIGKTGSSTGTLKYYLRESGVTDFEPKIRYLSNVKPENSDSEEEDENSVGSEESEPEMLTEREQYEEMMFGAG